MAPSDLRNASRLGDFTGIYLPYWTFDATTHARWKAEVGHTRTVTRYVNGKPVTHTVTDWRWESGEVQQVIDDLLVPGPAG